MIERNGQHGRFLACNQFNVTGCKNTQKVVGPANPEVIDMAKQVVGGWTASPVNDMVNAQVIPKPIAPIPKPIKEFHLSPEQVRTNACEIAISFSELKKFDNIGDVMRLAKDVEEYLWNGR
jgi:hypothetical protein